ncbi:MAG: SIMPL domain-containing protein [Gammaproteobacteria bacterium]
MTMIRPVATRKVILLALTLAGIGNPAPSFGDDNGHQPPRSINVTGTGRIFVVPDKADLILSVEIRAKNAESARNQAAASMSAIIKALKTLDVADKDIQTRHVSLYPLYEADKRNKISGYQLTNQLTVVIRNIQNVSKVIDSAINAGGDSTRIQGINFAVDKPESALEKAREKAFADARSKARQYAELADVKLGSAIHISEGAVSPPVPVPYAEMSAMKLAGAPLPTPVQAGEQEVTVTVDIAFAFE